MYLSLLRDPVSFGDNKSDSSSQAALSQCAVDDAAAELEHTKDVLVKNVGSKGRHVATHDSFREPRDEAVSSLCSCASREFNNSSSDEETSLQSTSDEAEGGGWYGNECSVICDSNVCSEA